MQFCLVFLLDITSISMSPVIFFSLHGSPPWILSLWDQSFLVQTPRTRFQCHWDGAWSCFEQQHTVAGASWSPRSYSCCQPESSARLSVFLSLQGNDPWEHSRKKTQVIGQNLSLASDTLQGWAGNPWNLHTAQVSTVKMELGTCGGPAWII